MQVMRMYMEVEMCKFKIQKLLFLIHQLYLTPSSTQQVMSEQFSQLNTKLYVLLFYIKIHLQVHTYIEHG